MVLEHIHIFITGCTNSGTGLLRFFMSKNKELSVLMQEGQHYCKYLPHDAKLGLKRRLFALYPSVYRWSKDDLVKHHAEKIKRDFYKNWDLSKKFLVEKSPHHMLRLEFMDLAFPPSKFIGIVRNGYAVAEGIHRRRGHKIKICAKQWNECNKIMMGDSEKIDFLLITYEDLCSDVQSTMDKVFDFIGVDPIKIKKKWEIPRLNICGDNKYFTVKKSPDFNKMSMKKLSDKDKKNIEYHASEMLRFFNYYKGKQTWGAH